MKRKRTRKEKNDRIIKDTILSYKNPKTGNIVSYVRAVQLHITDTAERFIKSPETGKYISLKDAPKLGLIHSEMFKKYRRKKRVKEEVES